jgi:hypothetical protein
MPYSVSRFTPRAGPCYFLPWPQNSQVNAFESRSGGL